MQPTTIIVGYDGGQAAEDAVAWRSHLAELTEARLLLAYAYRDGRSSQESAERMLRRGPQEASLRAPAAVRAVACAPTRPRCLPTSPSARAPS